MEGEPGGSALQLCLSALEKHLCTPRPDYARRIIEGTMRSKHNTMPGFFLFKPRNIPNCVRSLFAIV